MIIAEQVEIAVDQEPAAFVPRSGAGLTRLPSGRINGNHNVAQNNNSLRLMRSGGQPASPPAPPIGGTNLQRLRRKCQHVSRAIDPSVAIIDPAHLAIVDEREADHGGGSTGQREEVMQQPTVEPDIDRHAPLPVHHADTRGGKLANRLLHSSFAIRHSPFGIGPLSLNPLFLQ